MANTPYIPRETYLKRIMPFVGKDLIKVFVGQRRVGKSTMMLQVQDRLRDENPDLSQIAVNRERHEFAHLRSGEDLVAYVDERVEPEQQAALFVDEIQDIAGFEHALRHFQSTGRFDIYCTGSNAKLLSGELATLLSGRYVEFKIFSLSYAEFLTFHQQPRGQDAFAMYLKYGGLPYLHHLPRRDDVVFDYLRNIVDAILLKDIVARFQIRNVNFLTQLSRYVADNVGSLVSARRISDFLKSQQIKISHNMVLDYLNHLTQAMLIFNARRMDVRGRKVFETNEKFYFEDLGVRHALVGYRSTDISKLLENVVYMHLLMAGYQVWVGKLGQHEIDFVCEKNGERLYVQVAYLIPDEQVRQREFGNLAAIPDNYPKVVVSMDAQAEGSLDGIRHQHVEDFIFQLPSE